MLNEPVEIKFGSTAHDRYGPISQLLTILPKLPPLPEVTTQPRPRQWPHRPGRHPVALACRERKRPRVRVVVGYPPPHVVHGARRILARIGELGQPAEQWPMALSETGGLGGPVVHLDIDVGGVVRTPRRPQFVVPNALQIERPAAWTRSGNH